MDAQTKDAFRRIAANEPRFVEWLSAELGATNQILTFSQPEVVLRQAQGKAQFLHSLIEHLTRNP